MQYDVLMYCRGQYIARIAWTRSNLININEKRSCLLPQNVNQLFFFMKTRGVNLLICVCHMTFLHLMSYFLGSSGNYTIQFKFVIIHFHIAIHQYIASILCTISNMQICHIVTALVHSGLITKCFCKNHSIVVAWLSHAIRHQWVVLGGF